MPSQLNRLGYRPIDADGHYYEPYDAYTRHIEAKYKSRAVNVRVSEKDGLGRLYISDEKAGLIRVVQCDYTGAPGSRAGAFLGIHNGEDPGGWSQPEAISAHDFPAMMNREARIALLDEQGIAVRAGQHCAMPLLAGLGLSGAVRVSLGLYNDGSDLARFFAALDQALELLR